MNCQVRARLMLRSKLLRCRRAEARRRGGVHAEVHLPPAVSDTEPPVSGLGAVFAGPPQATLADSRSLYLRRPEGQTILIRGPRTGSPGGDYVFAHGGTQ